MQFQWRFGSLIDVNAIALIAETNPAEAGDLLASLPLSLRLMLGLALVAGTRAVIHPWQPKPATARKMMLISGVVLSFVLLTVTLPSLAGFPPDDETNRNAFIAPLLDEQEALRAAFPAGVPFVLGGYLKERAALTKVLIANKSFSFGAHKILATGGGRRIFVVVVGETSRADRWGLNGYQRNTTPQLGARKDLLSFTKMHSHATFTRISVPVILSRKPPQSRLSTFGEASIITAFKEAGFHTAWISLQAPLGFHESPVTAIAGEADEVVFLNPVDYRRKGRRDAESIPELERIIAANERDLFVVIHALGSHFRYTDRYGPEFARFVPDRYPRRLESLYAPEDKEVLSNAYDNSILATDAFLAGLIERLADYNGQSWMLYVSDHGEALFDDCRQESGHGQSSKATHHVASVFWASPQFVAGYPDLMKRTNGNASRLASTGMIFDTLTSLGGLEIPGYRQELDMTGSMLSRPLEIEALGLEKDRCSQ